MPPSNTISSHPGVDTVVFWLYLCSGQPASASTSTSVSVPVPAPIPAPIPVPVAVLPVLPVLRSYFSTTTLRSLADFPHIISQLSSAYESNHQQRHKATHPRRKGEEELSDEAAQAHRLIPYPIPIRRPTDTASRRYPICIDDDNNNEEPISTLLNTTYIDGSTHRTASRPASVHPASQPTNHPIREGDR
ncbi:hypothetical protein EX30DRAFT_348440 [Ascodesmis nigricans]|uniref:Uncharacterized protein n=1 Tax=Ascodesmis nigricans TaxID=341454 RepID=A0A4V3SIV0_9PEZI|nr:hypothetical protein EX30DRAFT_348440 [Ascodesmis nigricans]